MSFKVYKISNTINARLYVGRTVNIADRWCLHRGDAIKRMLDKPLYRDMRLFGVDKFSIEVIEECPDEKTTRHREIYWMRILGSIYPQGYNLESPLTDTEAAIIKYNAWSWSMEQYSQFFGYGVGTLRLIRTKAAYSHVTRDDLPKVAV